MWKNYNMWQPSIVEIVIFLEGVYAELFINHYLRLAVLLYDTRVYAYYFDLPFEKRKERHQIKPTACGLWWGKEMRRWHWEKDFSAILNEVSITSSKDKEIIVEVIMILLSTHKFSI